MSDIQTPRSYMSSTRRSVSSDVQIQEGVFYLISKHLEVIYQTREGVIHMISICFNPFMYPVF